MHAFSKELYDTMGVRVFIFGCYLKPDGTLDVSTYDFNQELGNGKDFIDNHSRTFHEEGISVSSWRAHNEEYYGLEDLASAEGGHRSRGAMTLEKNLYLEPILPDPSKPPVKTSRDIRIWRLNVLRAFVNQHYSEPVPRDFLPCITEHLSKISQLGRVRDRLLGRLLDQSYSTSLIQNIYPRLGDR
jgi:hypothetical protein